MDRQNPEFEHTEFLEDYKVEGIRLVPVPHMSTLQPLDSNYFTNVRTNVGMSGELWVIMLFLLRTQIS